MRDLYSVKAGWGLREETAEACASRCVRMLNGLWDIHPDFRTLHWTGSGQQVAARNLRELCRSGDLPRLLKKRRVHNASRTRIVADGYELDARSGAGSSQSLLLHLHAGTGSEDADRVWLPNQIELAIILGSDVDAAAEMLLALKPILFAIVDAWDADWGGLYSTGRTAQTIEQFRWRFAGAWAVYVAERFARRVVPPAQGFVERHPNGGMLMSAAKDVFSADDTAHVEAANAIDASLAPVRPWPDD